MSEGQQFSLSYQPQGKKKKKRIYQECPPGQTTQKKNTKRKTKSHKKFACLDPWAGVHYCFVCGSVPVCVPVLCMFIGLGHLLRLSIFFFFFLLSSNWFFV